MYRERQEEKRKEMCEANILGEKLLFRKIDQSDTKRFSGTFWYSFPFPLCPISSPPISSFTPVFFPFTHTFNQSDRRKQVAQGQKPAFPSARLCKALCSIFKPVFFSLTSFLQRFTLCPIRHL